MNEHRLKILQMLSAGQITAEEAERLIIALERGLPAPASADDSAPSPKVKPKYLRVIVESEKDGASPKTVNIRVPMQLLRAGVKLTSLIPAQARERVNEAMRRDGVPFDLNQIKPENLEELIYHLDALKVDIVDSGDNNKKAKVTLFFE